MSPALGKVTLTAKPFKGEHRMSVEVTEDSIEREGFVQTVLEGMAERAGLDIEDELVNGDTGSGDTFVASFDGMIKAATSHTVAAGTVNLNKSILRDMLKTVPTQYKRNKGRFKYYTSVNAECDYVDTLMNRQTPMGDAKLSQGGMGTYASIPLVGVPVFPENLGTGTNETDALLLDPKCAVLGVWRDIRVEYDKLVSDQVFIFVATCRVGFKYIVEDSVVKATGIKVSG